MKWNRVTETILRHYWEIGYTSTDISKILHITRNAVMGRVNKLGINRCKVANDNRYKPVLLQDLAFSGCAYEIHGMVDMENVSAEEFLFCNKQTVKGKPYCADHCNICYRIVPTKKCKIETEEKLDYRFMEW